MLRTIAATDIRPRALRWLWRDRVPLGAVTILAGDGGLGKSTLTVELAAELSRGQLEGDLWGVPSASYLLSVEDDSETTITPRLIAANADLGCVHFADENHADSLPTLPDDHEALTETIRALDVKLLVLDPLAAFLHAKIDSWKDQQVRRAMAPVSRLARQTDIAVIGVMHLNRRETTSASARISGSPAFRNAVRSVLMFGFDPDDSRGSDGPHRIIAQEKSNLTRPGLHSLACRIESVDLTDFEGEAISTSRIVLLGDSTATARQILDPSARNTSASERFLLAALSGGPRRAGDVMQEANQHGLSEQNLRTARERLGIKPQKRGGRANGCWEWSLPDLSSTSSTSSPVDVNMYEDVKM